MIERDGEGRFRILGPLEIRAGEAWAGVPAVKWRALLAALLLNAGQIVPTDRLIGEIWGEKPPASAANLVSVYVHRLRRLLGETGGTVLVTRSPGYLIMPGSGEVDADRFTAAVTEGRRALDGGDPGRAAGLLAAALELWRGRALADVPSTPLVSAESDRLEDSRVGAQVLLAEAELAIGRHAQVVPGLRRLLADHPLREELWALLLRALHGAGRQAEALEAYAKAREVIADELGVDPGPQLQQIYHQILNADATSAAAGAPPAAPRRPTALSPAPVPAPRAPGAAENGGDGGPGERGTPAGSQTGPDEPSAGPPGRPVPAAPLPPMPAPAELPADIADFTGRSAQVEELRGLLKGAGGGGSPGAVPVVLVMGSGGLGKTALAVHAAHHLASQFPDGQLYVNLLGATTPAEPGEVLARFLRDLGVDGARIPVGLEERAGQYRTRLAGKRVLILLDDARDAAQVAPLLPGSASCAVLITSRHAMPELVGASVMDLDVLPPAEARDLFTTMVGQRRAAADTAATEGVLTACAGLPLAIRIAGARLAARGGWSVAALGERLADERRRLDELRVGNLAVRASFEVSFAALARQAGPGTIDPTAAFRLLGLWTGPSFSLPAATALLGQDENVTSDALEMLVDAHLLETLGADRYRFHDLLRVYAADRARTEESPHAQREAITRLLSWYLHTTENAANAISAQRRQVPIGTPPPGVAPLPFATLDEALAWCDDERLGIVAATRLAAQAGLYEIAWKLPATAMMYFFRRSHWLNWISSHNIGLESARATGDRLGEGWMLNNLGMVYALQRREESVACFEQALTINRELDNGAGEAQAATNAANAYFELSRYAEALDAAERSLVIQRRVGDRYGEGITLGILGGSCRELGRPQAAVEYLQQALAIFRDLGDLDAEAVSLDDLGDTYLGLGEVTHAISYLRDSLAIRRAIGHQRGQAATLLLLGRAHVSASEPEMARDLLGQALGLFEELRDQEKAHEVQACLAQLAREAG
jgi:DNA-binding SARP family transcriptional activator